MPRRKVALEASQEQLAVDRPEDFVVRTARSSTNPALRSMLFICTATTALAKAADGDAEGVSRSGPADWAARFLVSEALGKADDAARPGPHRSR